MRCLVLPVARDHHHVDHVGGETEAIAELLHRHRSSDHGHAGRLGDREEDENGDGHMHGEDHRPQHPLQAKPRNHIATDQAAQGQRDDADRAVNNTDLLGGQTQAAHRARIEQKGRDQLEQLGLGQPIDQQVGENGENFLFAEKRREHLEVVRRQRGRAFNRHVTRRPRQDGEVIQARQNKEHREHDKNPGPRLGHVPRHVLQRAGQINEPALTRDHRETIKRAAHPDKRGLLMRRQGEQIKSIRRDVMRRRAEGHQPEDRQRVAEKIRPGHGQSHQRQRGADHELQADNPPAFGAEQVHQRRPQRLDDPGQVEPARVERDVGVRNLEVLIHDDRQRHHDHVGNALGEIERRDPAPRTRRTGRRAIHQGAGNLVTHPAWRNG